MPRPSRALPPAPSRWHAPTTRPPEAITEHIRTELSVDRFAEQMASAQFLVVDGADGEVCGYVMLATDPPPIQTEWANPLELRRIYVD